METRKVYVSGGSTYIVSLPKKWVIKNKIKAGDSLVVTRQSSSLMIEPGVINADIEAVKINTSDVPTPESLERLIIAYYLGGYDTIKIKLDSMTPEYKDSARRVLDFLIGIEIVEDLGDTVTLEILLDHRKMRTPLALRRIYLIVKSMIKDSIKVMESGDGYLARDIISREREVDRFYFLILRQLKSAVQYQQIAEKLGIKNQRDTLGYRIVVKSLERIADHVENVMNSYLDLIDEKKEAPDLEEFICVTELVLKIYNSSMESLFNRDKIRAEKVFRSLSSINTQHQELSNKFFLEGINIPDTMHKKSILDSIRRIADYSSDIAEIALNMAVEVPTIQTNREKK